jgi:hypothetical protein
VTERGELIGLFSRLVQHVKERCRKRLFRFDSAKMRRFFEVQKKEKWTQMDIHLHPLASTAIHFFEEISFRK